jgi:hypothetical protein
MCISPIIEEPQQVLIRDPMVIANRQLYLSSIKWNLLLPHQPISINTKSFALESDREAERSDILFERERHAMNPSLFAR